MWFDGPQSTLAVQLNSDGQTNTNSFKWRCPVCYKNKVTINFVKQTCDFLHDIPNYLPCQTGFKISFISFTCPCNWIFRRHTYPCHITFNYLPAQTKICSHEFCFRALPFDELRKWTNIQLDSAENTREVG